MYTNRLIFLTVLLLISTGCSRENKCTPHENVPGEDVYETTESQDTMDASQEDSSNVPSLSRVSEPEASAFYFKPVSVKNDEFSVELRLKGMKGVFLIALTLRYDPRYLELTDIQAEDVFDEASSRGILRAIEVPKGRISIGGAYFGFSNQRDFEDETLAILHFKVIERGTTVIHILPGSIRLYSSNKGVTPRLYDLKVTL